MLYRLLAWIKYSDERKPWVAIGALIAVTIATGAGILDREGLINLAELLEDSEKVIPVIQDKVWNHTAHLLMWFFFSLLGCHITLKALRASGKVTIISIVFGVLGPFWVVYALTQNFYLALAATATDVAFSMAGIRLLKLKLALLVGLIMMLAVGDDLSGVAGICAFLPSNVRPDWIFAGTLLVLVCYLIGEGGLISTDTESTTTTTTTNPDGSVTKVVTCTLTTSSGYMRVMAIPFWWMLAGMNTYILARAGLEPILGGCLVFILAPTRVKVSATKNG